jgi:surface carbohydrate biosynthesis protein
LDSQDISENILTIKGNIDFFIILDEESGPGREDFHGKMRMRIYPGTENFIDRYYVIGKHAYDVGQVVLPELGSKIEITGWPRVDLWRPEFLYLYDNAVSSLRRNHGIFILITADYGYNSQKRIDDALEVRKNSEWESVRRSVSSVAIKASNTFAEYQACMQSLRKLDERDDLPQIIIRPHPAEDHAEWQRVAKTFKRIKVIYEGEVSAWIYAASAVLHRGCTSAVQAYMAGIPAGYIVTKEEWIKQALPYQVSEHLYNSEDIANFCKKYIDHKPVPPTEYSEAFKNMIHIEKDKYASELIVEDMLKLGATPEPPYQAGVKDMLYDMLLNVRSGLKRVRDRVFKTEQNIGIAPQSQKMPGGITKKEVEDFLHRLDPNRKFKVRQVFKDCVEIEE